MTNLALNGYGEIRVTDDGRYSVYDTIRVCGGKRNPWETWKRLSTEYSEVFAGTTMHKFPGARQRETPVVSLEATEQIMRFLSCHPEQSVFANDRYYPRTETQITSVLKAAFYDCDPCPQFYCSGYRIDLYLAKPRVAIEIDERDHSGYCKKNEAKREQTIKNALGCSFIRFDPYDAGFNLGVVVARIRDLVGSGNA